MLFDKKIICKFIYKFKYNLPIINFFISTTSLYLQCNYLFDKKMKNI